MNSSAPDSSRLASPSRAARAVRRAALVALAALAALALLAPLAAPGGAARACLLRLPR